MDPEEVINEAEIEESTSPLPEEEVKPETMTFPEAIAEATIGKRIQRLAWPQDEYGFFKNEFLAIHKDGKDYDVWQITKGDAVESDWVSF